MAESTPVFSDPLKKTDGAGRTEPTAPMCDCGPISAECIHRGMPVSTSIVKFPGQ